MVGDHAKGVSRERVHIHAMSLPLEFHAVGSDLGKLKIAPCTLSVKYTLCANVMYEPRIFLFVIRYSLACSSDQKKIELRQKPSMILGSSNVLKSTIGTKTNGSASGLETVYSNSLFISIWNSFPQCAHEV